MSFLALRTPSFRSRLRLFFVVIVVFPMLTMAVVLFQLIVASERSRTDARLSEARTVAQEVHREAQAQAGEAAQQIGRDQGLADARETADRPAIQRRLDQLLARENAEYAELQLDSLGAYEAGELPAVAPAELGLIDEEQRSTGRLAVSMLSADEYAERISSLTGADVVLSQDGERLESTRAGAPAELPEEGPVSVEGTDYRVASFEVGAVGGPLEVSLLMPNRDTADPTARDSLFAAAAFVGFLALAFVFAVAVSRRLQAEIQRLLVAAQRLGSGDFSVAVPAEGNDEFAQLGKEFNSMARQLESRLEELQRERARLQEAIRRVGESFAAGLDRVGLLEIVVQTAVDGIGASAGRATMRGAENRLQEVARAGEPESFRRALHAAEAAVIDAGQVAEIQVGGASALAAPLGATEDGDQVIGIVSVARGDRAFTHGERELFAYLTNQASVSVENVDLHETVQRQAVTDELTGLFNHRRFQEVMTAEVERARRYGHELGLIMLDIDNFKQVNDTHGHLQGDMVLGEVARVLRQSSREIDEPARYGGEEMAVALPQTDLEGAYQFAERVRGRIEALELPRLSGDGTLRVTASFGVASLASAGTADKDALVAAADGALYEAKRSGKNRTVRAGSGVRRRRGVHGVASTE
ncbi:MAG TPA: diguanylate cyclase [Solirubrobacteraceae bacterium]|nr:diguanylate cyclase [Solirubrobacteraceae bacterium]